ncbi:MAG TPA: hypothetical protein VGV35_11495 [Bryobacteraceae bacterium]|nr:hypothetical protein [Bryobacteraceae bacterium]
MTKAIVTTLLASGLLLAAKSDKMAGDQKLSGNQREALETQSPRVHVGKHHKKHAADRVVSDKKTINAYVQSRK